MAQLVLNNKIKLFLLFAFGALGLFLFKTPALAATEVSGLFFTDQTWSVTESPYIVKNAGSQGGVSMAGGAVLTVEPGVIVKVEQGAQISTGSGSITAVGTESAPIVFTALTDDSAGGDTNGDNNATSPTVGYWSRISSGNDSDQFEFAEIRYANQCLGLSFNSATVKNSIVENCSFGINANNLGSGTVITDNIVRNNRWGLQFVSAGGTGFSNNQIVNNSDFGALNIFESQVVDGRNNWWGDASGPFHPTQNPGGLGNEVTSGILFDPWLNQEPGTEQPTIDPVIIIPGILGSFQKDGEWVIDPVLHTYDNLIETLIANGYKDGVDLFTFPYEWRDSNTQTAILLRDKINEVQAICSCNKVDLVAHSMGGLVARQYIQSPRYEDDVDQLIFLGTPHLGAPDAYLPWEAGRVAQNGITEVFLQAVFGFEAFKNGVQEPFEYIRSRPVSSVQELLPVYDYIRDGNTGFLRTYPNEYPQNLFLESLTNNVNNLLSSGVEVTNIVGNNGADDTSSIIRVVEPPSIDPLIWEHGYPEGFDNIFFGDRGLEKGVGDNRVPDFSARFIDQGQIDLDSEHQQLPTISQAIIYNKLTGESASTIIDEDRFPSFMLFISMLSPADMVVIAPDGKRIGKDFATGQEFSEIEGAFYSGFQTDNEFITISNPLDGEYKIVTEGTDEGSYTVAVGYVTDDTLVETEATVKTEVGLVTELGLVVDNSQPELIDLTVVDDTPPEAIILFDLELQDVVVSGIDDLSEIVEVVQAEKLITLTDQSGNTTELHFKKKIKNRKKSWKAEIEKIVYNGAEVQVSKNTIKFVWRYDKQGELKRLDQLLNLKKDQKIELKYKAKKDETKITNKMHGSKKEKSIEEGLIFLKIKTNNGEIEYEDI